jgi:hypothetical protein
VKERASSRSKRTENSIKENIKEAKVKDCYIINKDQLVEMEKWSRKEKVMKQKGNLRKEETEKYS